MGFIALKRLVAFSTAGPAICGSAILSYILSSHLPVPVTLSVLSEIKIWNVCDMLGDWLSLFAKTPSVASGFVRVHFTPVLLCFRVLLGGQGLLLALLS